jgi:hypothetical protein
MSKAVSNGLPCVALGPRGTLEIWSNLPEVLRMTAYAFVRGYLEQVRVYGEDGRLFKIRRATPVLPLGAFRRLLARTVYNPGIDVRLEYESSIPYPLDELKEGIFAALALDDDVITQFHDAATIRSWVEGAATYSEVVQALRRTEQEGADA